MIYLGLWTPHNASHKGDDLVKQLKEHTEDNPKYVTIQNLVLAYGKQSSLNDMDQVWEGDSSVLIGSIFDKETYTSIPQSEFRDAARKLRKDLSKKVWGKYVYWCLDDLNTISVGSVASVSALRFWKEVSFLFLGSLLHHVHKIMKS